jgi:hypothetical protein
VLGKKTEEGMGVSEKERGRAEEEAQPGGCRLRYLIMHNFQGKRQAQHLAAIINFGISMLASYQP